MAKGGFRGGFPGGGQLDMMKQAQKMQQEFMKMQQELESRKFVATAGGGMVKATLLGTREFESVEINPEAVDPEDVEMLQDMVMAAVNEALRQGEENREKTMSALAPAGMGGMF